MKRRRIGLLLAAAVCLLACRPASIALPASGAPVKRVLWIDLDEKTLRVYEKDRVTARYAIASGAPDTPSPVGVFRVNTRFSTEMSGFGTRVLGLSVPWGSYGIHGTNKPSSIGKMPPTAASACRCGMRKRYIAWCRTARRWWCRAGRMGR